MLAFLCFFPFWLARSSPRAPASLIYFIAPPLCIMNFASIKGSGGKVRLGSKNVYFYDSDWGETWCKYLWVDCGECHKAKLISEHFIMKLKSKNLGRVGYQKFTATLSVTTCVDAHISRRYQINRVFPIDVPPNSKSIKLWTAELCVEHSVNLVETPSSRWLDGSCN